ncbi:MAG TPA: sulfite exporter TauE/SafE family protein [Streptosporangiaceae bacterium]|nr:sulfite exporter TauE/SafE family protein [Streptosporangiaceae bacterium]
MSLVEVLALAAAGVVAGIVSTVVSLASVVSYPALLAIGLPPLSANMTNTVSLLFTGVGAAVGSRPELTGQVARIRRLAPIAALGGAAGATLLLITPAQAFEHAAPILIAAASLVLLFQPRRERDPGRGTGSPGASTGEPSPGAAEPGPAGDAPGPAGDVPGPAGDVPGPGGGGHGSPGRERNPFLLAGVFGVAAYTGYFGAAGGIIMLAVLTAMVVQPLVRTNALKNVLGGIANTVAAVAFAVFGQVDWAAVAPLAAGFLVGGWTGPALVRRIPAQALRLLVVACGLAVAAKLASTAYR